MLIKMLSQKEAIQININKALKIIRMYEWLLDMYVVDYFVDSHWEKLPSIWQKSFEDIDPKTLGNALSGLPYGHLYPLSFLALLSAVKSLSIPRENCNSDRIPINNDHDHCGSHPRLKNLFLKHVKLKKQHEISLMADIVKETALKSKCMSVIDFGSGVGHLVRVLAYKYDLNAAGIECQSQLTEEARKMDAELEYTASKHLSDKAMSNLKRPTHLNVNLTSCEQIEQLSLPKRIQDYGLVGLHPCGDLGPLLLKHFVKNDNVKFICVVGCCYMKLSCVDTDNKNNVGYPMSNYVKDLDNKLSYVSREIACHAIEDYCERLRGGRYEDLKIHAYRAALEKILVELDPKLKHSQVRSVKHSDTLTFERYCSLAIERITFPLSIDPQDQSAHWWALGEQAVSSWRRVVTLYSLRLALAPLVETVLLLDRVLFVLEHGISCEIRPVFDPRISPRNHIIIARK